MPIHNKIIFHPDGVGIHMMATVTHPDKPTLAFLPGMSSIAEDGIECLTPCLVKGVNIASMSFRGRGQSSTPVSGYTVEDHANDIELFLKNLDCSNVFLIANSIAAAYAVQYLITRKPYEVKGLVIVDHPLCLQTLSTGWAEAFSKRIIVGRPALDTMRKVAMEGIEKESGAMDLYPDFYTLGIPIMVMAASIGKGLLTEKDISLYENKTGTKIVNFEDSDHFIRLREPEKFRREMLEFYFGCSA